MDDVKNFYNQIQFPGAYSVNSLDYHNPIITNPYLRLIDKFLLEDQTVLDVGCGSGFITNFFAKKYNRSHFIGIDFSPASIKHARYISQEANIQNTNFINADFTVYDTDQQFDVVICQGVLHHMPNYGAIVKKLTNAVKDNGYLILGMYHPWGKIAKKYFGIDYQDQVLYIDQECHPYELSFTYENVKSMFPEFKLENCYPKFFGLVALPNLFNYKNGGLTTYVFKKNY